MGNDPLDERDDVDVEAEARLRNVTHGLKQQADQLMMNEQYSRAVHLYRDLLMHLTKSHVKLLQQKDLVISCRMNLLMASSKLKQWANVIAEATETKVVIHELEAETKEYRDSLSSDIGEDKDDSSFEQLLARVYYFRGYAQMRLGAFASAEKDFQKVLKLSPTDQFYQEEWEELQDAIQTEMRVKQHLSAATKHFQANQFKQAIECNLKALSEAQVLKKDELTGFIHSNLATTYVKARDDVKATEQYKRALVFARQQPNPTATQNERIYDILDGLAGCYSRRKDYSSALSVVEDEIVLFPSCPKRQDRASMMYLNAGRVSYTLSKLDESVKYFIKAEAAALSANQTDVALHCMLWLSKAYTQLGEHDQAATVLDKAIPLADKNENVDKLYLARLELMDSGGLEITKERESQLWRCLEHFETKKQVHGVLRAADVLVTALSAAENDLKHQSQFLRVLQVVDGVNIGSLPPTDASIFMHLVLTKVDLLVNTSSIDIAKDLLTTVLYDLKASNASEQNQKFRLAALRKLADICQLRYEEEDEETCDYLMEAIGVLRNGQHENTDAIVLSGLLTKMARYKAQQGELHNAQEMLEESVCLVRRIYGDDSEKLCEALVGLCVLHLKHNNYQKAKEIMEEIETFSSAKNLEEVKLIKNQLLARKEQARKQSMSTVDTENTTKEASKVAVANNIWRSESWLAILVSVIGIGVCAVVVGVIIFLK